MGRVTNQPSSASSPAVHRSRSQSRVVGSTQGPEFPSPSRGRPHDDRTEAACVDPHAEVSSAPRRFLRVWPPGPRGHCPPPPYRCTSTTTSITTSTTTCTL
ncbi:unnamed protein product [Lampetra planeri]